MFGCVSLVLVVVVVGVLKLTNHYPQSSENRKLGLPSIPRPAIPIALAASSLLHFSEILESQIVFHPLAVSSCSIAKFAVRSYMTVICVMDSACWRQHWLKPVCNSESRWRSRESVAARVTAASARERGQND